LKEIYDFCVYIGIWWRKIETLGFHLGLHNWDFGVSFEGEKLTLLQYMIFVLIQVRWGKVETVIFLLGFRNLDFGFLLKVRKLKCWVFFILFIFGWEVKNVYYSFWRIGRGNFSFLLKVHEYCCEFMMFSVYFWNWLILYCYFIQFIKMK